MAETNHGGVLDETGDGIGDEPPVCYHCLVEGRVQGVYFRGATREQALRLGVTGYVRNLPDGRVEVLACGRPAAVTQLCEWLRSGPPMARVNDLKCEPRAYHAWPGFAVN
jgi:acylphosphatase